MKFVKLLFFATLIAVVPTLLSNSGGSTPENAGAPGEQTCARSGCHNTTANVGSAMVNIDFNNGATLYRTDSTYSVTFSISNSVQSKHGFQAVAVDVANANAGAWTLTDQNNTRLRNGFTLPDRRYVTHTGSGNQLTTWSADWTAPSTDVGDITFYASFLQTNNNGSTSGDSLYTTSFTISIDPANSSEQVSIEDVLEVFPNPATEYIRINNTSSEQLMMNIYNMNGQVVKSEQLQPNQNTITIEDWAAGLYLIQLQNKAYNGTFKIIKN